MIEAELCSIVEGAGVRVEDLQTAVNLLLRRRLKPGEPRLQGRKALELRSEGRNLFVRLAATTRSGLHFEAEDWLVLPPLEGGDLVRVGLEWEPCPVTDGSAIYCGQPRMRLLAEGELGFDGEFVIAHQADNGLVSLPVFGDCLDACEATAMWVGAIEDQLRLADQSLAVFSARLQRTGAPVLLWGWLLQPVWAKLSQARGLAVETAPEVLTACCRRWLSALAELPARSVLLGNRHVTELMTQLQLEAVGAEPAEFHQRCDAISSQLAKAVAALNELLKAVGSGLQQLPELLYQADVLYRRRSSVSFQTESAAGATTLRHFAPTSDSGRTHLAVLWEVAEPMLLGDVRFVPQAAGRAGVRREEVFLGNLEPGVDFHWLPNVVLDHARLESPSGLRLREAATYEPAV